MRYAICLLSTIALTSCGIINAVVQPYSDIQGECLMLCRLPIEGPANPTPAQLDRVDSYNAEVHGECISRHRCLVEAVRARQ